MRRIAVATQVAGVSTTRANGNPGVTLNGVIIAAPAATGTILASTQLRHLMIVVGSTSI